MFFSLFNKFYLTDWQDNVNYGKEFIDYRVVYSTDVFKNLPYTEFREMFPDFHCMYQCLKKFKHNKKAMTIFVWQYDDIVNFMSDYLSYLNITPAAKTLTSHSNFCLENIENLASSFSDKAITAEEITSKTPYFKRHIKKDFEDFPAEYCYNCIDENWAAKKYKHFLYNEMFYEIKRLQQRLYYSNSSDEKIEKVLSKFKNDQDAYILADEKVFQEIIDVFFIYNIEIEKYSSLENYRKLSTTFSYNEVNYFKFNPLLLKYVKEHNYRIDKQ